MLLLLQTLTSTIARHDRRIIASDIMPNKVFHLDPTKLLQFTAILRLSDLPIDLFLVPA